MEGKRDGRSQVTWPHAIDDRDSSCFDEYYTTVARAAFVASFESYL